MRRGYRQERIGAEIRKIISDMLLREIKDPRLADGMVSITDVEVTRDGSYAKVFLGTIYGNALSDEPTDYRVYENIKKLQAECRKEALSDIIQNAEDRTDNAPATVPQKDKDR